MGGKMFNCKKDLFILIFLCFLSQTLLSQITFQGYVTDNGGEYLGSGAEPVKNALVTLIYQSDMIQSYSDFTDEQGHFEIQVPLPGIKGSSLKSDRFQLLPNYPNPFNPSTVIGYELSQPCHVKIEVYNVAGQKVKTLLNRFQNTSGSVIWDGTNDQGRPVTAGLYIYSMQTKDDKYNKKMLLIDGGSSGISTMATRVDPQHSTIQTVNKNRLSNQFVLKISGENILSYQELIKINGNTTRNVTVKRAVTDIDDNVYQAVKIGKQWWTAENLQVIHYRNGDAIPEITNNSEWIGLSTGARCAYDNDVSNVSTYGYLYNWYAVDDSRNIAPAGWHVPTHEEWQALVDYLGGKRFGGKLKETGTTHWHSPNVGATNESGFSALPAGLRVSHSGAFDRSDSAWGRFMYHGSLYIFRSLTNKNEGFSVRLIRD